MPMTAEAELGVLLGSHTAGPGESLLTVMSASRDPLPQDNCAEEGRREDNCGPFDCMTRSGAECIPRVEYIGERGGGGGGVDGSELKFPASARPVFGRAQRGANVQDPELARNCPEARLGSAGPGFVYTPNDRRVSGRPRSAPSWTMCSRKPSETLVPVGSTTAKVAPSCYGAGDGALGVQRDSRRKTGRSSSFSRSERFPTAKPFGGELTEECRPVDSGFGRQRTSRRGHGTGPSATFGFATRQGAQKAKIVRGPDEHPAARMGPPRMPHPQVASRQELIRYGSSTEKTAVG